MPLPLELNGMLRLTELIKQDFGVLELYYWFVTETCF